MATLRFKSRAEHELSVVCEDRPGTLAQIAQLFAEAKVNILAVSCAPSGMQGAVRLVVDRPDRAKKALDQAHVSYAEHDVLYVELPNVPGALAEFAGRLASQNINLTTSYGTSTSGSKKMVVVFRVSDLAKSLKLR